MFSFCSHSSRPPSAVFACTVSRGLGHNPFGMKHNLSASCLAASAFSLATLLAFPLAGAAAEREVAGRLRLVSETLYPHAPDQVHRLEDGRLLVYGAYPHGRPWEVELRDSPKHGHNSWADGYDVTEVWNPRIQRWEVTASLRGQSFGHRSVRLKDGRIALIGGGTFEQDVTSRKILLWDPLRENWYFQGPELKQSRLFHTATAMPDGRVLIAGGSKFTNVHHRNVMLRNRIPLASVEWFDGAAVTEGPALHTTRERHSAVVLPDGGVLVTGGAGGADGATPGDSTGDTHQPRLTVGRLPENRPKIDIWAYNTRALNSVEYLPPGGTAWQVLAPMRAARYSHVSLVRPDGRVVVIGGRELSGREITSVEIWDPVTKSWSDGPTLPNPLSEPSATLLGNGDMLVVGGANGQNAFLWRAQNSVWEPAGRAPTGLGFTTVLPIENNDALVMSGNRIYHWLSRPVSAPEKPEPYRLPALLPLRNGSILVAGGDTERVELFDPVSGQWRHRSPLPLVLAAPRAVELTDGHILLAGTDKNQTAHCFVGWLAEGRWEACPGFRPLVSAPVREVRPWPFVLEDGRVLLPVSRERVVLWSTGRDNMVVARLRRDNPNPFRAPDRSAGYSSHVSYKGPPAFSFEDPKDGEWRDATAAVLPSLGGSSALRLPDGKVLVSFSEGGLALWDAKAAEWQVLRDQRKQVSMGAPMVLLPDGCVLGWMHVQPKFVGPALGKPGFVLIDPRDLSLRQLHSLFVDVREGSLALLADGTAMVLGVDRSGYGVGAMRRYRASCQGVVPVDETVSAMPTGRGAVLRRLEPDEMPAAVNKAAVSTTAATGSPAGGNSDTASPVSAWWLWLLPFSLPLMILAMFMLLIRRPRD